MTDTPAPTEYPTIGDQARADGLLPDPFNPTVFAVRVSGHGTDHLSLHVNRRLADARLREVAVKVWRERFGYELPRLALSSTETSLGDRLEGEGWTVRVEDIAVEL